MIDDDGARCSRVILFTSAWSRAYAPASLADDYLVAVCEREDAAEVDPMLVPTLELLAVLLEQLTPPLVTIKSATGEDVSQLMGMVERAAAGVTLR
jgi:hypothetical protein